MPSTSRTLSSAEERRVDVIAAATAAFAVRGYFGTNTTEIAREARISQAYLYRLFESKEALFVAVLQAARSRIRADLQAMLSDSDKEDEENVDALLADSVVEDFDTAMVLLHASAASVVPAIAEEVRECYQEQFAFLREHGATTEGIHNYIARAQYATALRAAGLNQSLAVNGFTLP